MTDDVTQADRDAAAEVAVLVEMRDLIRAGKADHHAEPFARHRQAAEQATVDKIVAWLRGLPCCSDGSQTAWVADAIQNGEWKQ